MTLLVILFVISTYVAVPWWAWTLGWLKVSCYVAFVIQQAVKGWQQHKIMKANEQYMTELANQYVSTARAMVGSQGRVPPLDMN